MWLEIGWVLCNGIRNQGSLVAGIGLFLFGGFCIFAGWFATKSGDNWGSEGWDWGVLGDKGGSCGREGVGLGVELANSALELGGEGMFCCLIHELGGGEQGEEHRGGDDALFGGV